MRITRPLFIFLVLVAHFRLQAQVAINTDATLPDASAMLDVKSTAKGVLVSRMTTAQRTAIATPADGLLVYDTDTRSFWYYKAAVGWQQITGGGGSLTLPYSGAANSASPLFSLTNAGDGTVLNIGTTGNGEGVTSYTGAGFGVHGLTSAQSSAGIVGDNLGGGEAVVGRTNSDIAGSVVGRNDGGGFGVRGFISTNTSGTAIGVYGQVGLNNSTGRAGRFENLNATNTVGNTLEVETNGKGNLADYTNGNAANFLVNNVNSVAAAVRGEVKTIFANFGAAGIFGVSSGTGGYAGLFHASNPSGNSPALLAISDGNGNGFTSNAITGNGVETSVTGGGNSLFAWIPSYGTGRAARFNNFNTTNTNDLITATTVGNGIGGNFKVDNTNGTSAAVKGEVNSIFANFGTAGVYGLSSGTGGYGGLFYASHPSGNGPALIAIANGNGNGITANAANAGDGVESSVDGSGNCFYGWVPNYATGKAARFINYNTANSNSTVDIRNVGTGAAINVNHTGSSGNIAVFQSGGVNVARIDKTGRSYSNGGFQASGADLAEAFDVEDDRSAYEPGDVLVISLTKERAVARSSQPYSSLVAGVYATKPGVLLSEETIDNPLTGKVPMGVIGVIPTKVCGEGGPVRKGDLLVSSSVPGVAMKADLKKLQPGQSIGKALEDYNGAAIEKIKVLVNCK